MTELDDTKASLKKIEASESSHQNIVNGLQESIKERDRNINRLKDQIKYYVAFAEHTFKSQPGDNKGQSNELNQSSLEELLKELQDAKEEVRSVRSQNMELKSQLEVIASQTRENSSLGNVTENGHERLSSSSPSSTSSSDSQEISQDEIIVPGDSPSMSKDLAMRKIEQKLKQAMQRIADLTSEKEQLEHIVVRLQDETDTVGEYITIYQYQRAQQKAQLNEKEQQLHSVAKDREDLKEKLAQLQGLLKNYLGQNELSDDPEEDNGNAGD